MPKVTLVNSGPPFQLSKEELLKAPKSYLTQLVVSRKGGLAVIDARMWHSQDREVFKVVISCYKGRRHDPGPSVLSEEVVAALKHFKVPVELWPFGLRMHHASEAVREAEQDQAQELLASAMQCIEAALQNPPSSSPMQAPTIVQTHQPQDVMQDTGLPACNSFFFWAMQGPQGVALVQPHASLQQPEQYTAACLSCGVQAAFVAAAAAEFLQADFRQDRLVSKGTELPVLSCTISLQLFDSSSSRRRVVETIDREDSALDETINNKPSLDGVDQLGQHGSSDGLKKYASGVFPLTNA